MQQAAPKVATGTSAARRTHLRWVICLLLFFATTINYVDRQVLGILAVPLQRDIGWSEADYGLVVTAFQIAYAVGLVGFGRLIDRLGTRLGYALSLAWWSVAAMAHALARSAFGFGVARFALGLGEAGNFPAAVKTVAEWFPRSERALATGLFNAGSNVGAVIGPLAVPWIALRYGWRWAFLLTGALGFAWLLPWWSFYRKPREHPRISAAELAHIEADPTDKAGRIPWLRLIPHRQTQALLIARFLTDPIWWFYLYWAPKFLHSNSGVDLGHLALPLVVVYMAADTGSVFGGWFSSWLIRRGWTVNAARKAALLACALMIAPIAAAPWVSNVWIEVLLLSLATAGHQGWAANIFTAVSDVFPTQAVASVVGLCGCAGAVGGMLVASGTGFVLQATGSYVPVFTLAGTAYLIALLLFHLIAPRLAPVDLAGR